jgi:hypothetical protein
MRTISTHLAMGVAAVILFVSPVSVRAASQAYWMDAFKSDALPMNGVDATLLSSQSPMGLSVFKTTDSKTIWQGWVPVTLPVGSAIQRVILQHGGTTSSAGSACMLYRVKFGKAPEALASAVSSSATAVAVQSGAIPDDKATILSGYRYFIVVLVAEGATCRGVKVVY